MPEPMSVIFTIVERGKGAAAIKLFTRNQVYLHTQFPGRGTATSEIMDILGLGTTEKDIIISYATAAAAGRLLSMLDNEMRGAVTSGGIIFSLPLTGLSNLVLATITYKTDLKKGDNKMSSEHKGENSLILITCNQGTSGNVMETAKKAGARGGTVLRAHLSGAEELERSYGLTMTPEKEILMIIVPNDIRNAVMESVNHAHGLRSEAEAVICSLGIDQFVRL